MKDHDAQFRDALIAQIPRMRVFAVALTRNRDSADDVVQDALLAAWQARATLREISAIGPWLLQIVRNASRRSRRVRTRDTADPLELSNDLAAIEADEQLRVESADARWALMRLSTAEREAIMLVAVQGLTYTEAAQVVGCPEGTMKSRVNRAREQLRTVLGHAEGLASPEAPRRKRSVDPTASSRHPQMPTDRMKAQRRRPIPNTEICDRSDADLSAEVPSA